MRDHAPITVKDIRGLYDRGNDEIVPPDHLVSSYNTVYTNYGVKTRFGSSVQGSGVVLSGIRRVHLYKKIGEATPREIILQANGEVLDRGVGTLIATVAGATDFFGITLYDRFYFTPIAEFADGVRALAGQNLWVYDGTGVARAAAGTGPAAGTITAVAGGAGRVEAGTRMFAIAFETASGFITKAGPTVFTTFVGAGGTVVNLSTIPVGPAGTIARHVLMSKVVRAGWTGNQNDIELFFLAGGRIADNVTTTHVVNAYDAELQSSADYLLDELTSIPAGVHLFEFKGRLGVAYGNDTSNLGLIRLSKVGQPESFSSIDGFCLVGPGDSTGVNCAASFRDNLLLKKDYKLYITSDNGQEPSAWEIMKIDDHLGSSHNGIVKGIDNTGAVNPDSYLFASRSGIILFDGSIKYPPLTDKISEIWARIKPSKFHHVHIIQDSINKRLHILVPLDNVTDINFWIYGDYSDGLDAQNIKWSVWQLAGAINVPQCAYLFYNIATRELRLRYSQSTSIMELDEASLSDRTSLNVQTKIDSSVEYAMLGDNEEGHQYHFGSIRSRILGAGSAILTVAGIDRVNPMSLTPWTLAASPGKEMERLCNFINERMLVRIEVTTLNHWFHINKLRVFSKFMWAGRPEE